MNKGQYTGSRSAGHPKAQSYLLPNTGGPTAASMGLFRLLTAAHVRKGKATGAARGQRSEPGQPEEGTRTVFSAMAVDSLNIAML